MGFTKVLEARNRRAERVVSVPASMFADTGDKPAGDEQIGLRRLSEADVQQARAQAAHRALALHDDHDGQIEAFNDALMAWAVARGTCSPDDVTAPFFEMAEDTVQVRLTSEGIRYLYDEIDRLSIEGSPLQPVATPEQLTELAQWFTTGERWGAVPAAVARRVMRLLAHVHEERAAAGEG